MRAATSLCFTRSLEDASSGYRASSIPGSCGFILRRHWVYSTWGGPGGTCTARVRGELGPRLPPCQSSVLTAHTRSTFLWSGCVPFVRRTEPPFPREVSATLRRGVRGKVPTTDVLVPSKQFRQAQSPASAGRTAVPFIRSYSTAVSPRGRRSPAQSPPIGSPVLAYRACVRPTW